MRRRRSSTSLMLLSALLVLPWPMAESNQTLPEPPTEQPLQVNSNHELELQIKVHAFLLWSSIGVLMPVGILLIRVSSSSSSSLCSSRAKLLYYAHVFLQITAVLLASAAVALSIKSFDNSFANSHQRLGLALYFLIFLQPLIAFLRPKRGNKSRRIWYVIHWQLGIFIVVAGFANMFVGLKSYHDRTGSPVAPWPAMLASQAALLAFLYLLQDRWPHIVRQGILQVPAPEPRREPAKPADLAVVRRSSVQVLQLRDLVRIEAQAFGSQ